MSKILDEWSVPKSIEFYLDGIKWIVGISTGALVFGLSFISEEGSSNLSRILFALSALGFGLTSFSGVFAYLWLTAHVNQKEKREKETLTTRSWSKMDSWYQIMLVSFRLGLILFAFFGVVLLLQPIFVPAAKKCLCDEFSLEGYEVIIKKK